MTGKTKGEDLCNMLISTMPTQSELSKVLAIVIILWNWFNFEVGKITIAAKRGVQVAKKRIRSYIFWSILCHEPYDFRKLSKSLSGSRLAHL